MTHVPVEMVDAARIARASLRLQRSVSTCFTKRPWQVPRALHPAALALEAMPSLRSWDLWKVDAGAGVEPACQAYETRRMPHLPATKWRARTVSRRSRAVIGRVF